jgi:dihydroorotate dehydrogenase (NAD+) catalytic subunit
MAIDIEKRVPKLANISGGLSGPAIRPVAVYMVYQVARSVKIPVIGVGGIMDYRNALEFFMAGASGIQIGTANFVDPGVSIKVIEGLKKFCEDQGITKIEEIIGSLKVE